jgi:hypothetical protein
LVLFFVFLFLCLGGGGGVAPLFWGNWGPPPPRSPG